MEIPFKSIVMAVLNLMTAKETVSEVITPIEEQPTTKYKQKRLSYKCLYWFTKKTFNQRYVAGFDRTFEPVKYYLFDRQTQTFIIEGTDLHTIYEILMNEFKQ